LEGILELGYINHDFVRCIMAAHPKTPRGFAAMDPERVKAIASMGGKSVPKEKRAFSARPDIAAAAGRKGGRNVDAVSRSLSQVRALASSAAGKTDLRTAPDTDAGN